MRRIALLSALCASSILLSTQNMVSARMGGDPKKTVSKQDTSNIDFQRFDLDGQVHDLMWCGYNDETILMHTQDGTIYRSRDRGLNWKRLKSLLHKQGSSVADDNQDVSDRMSLNIVLNLAGCCVIDWHRSQDDLEPQRRSTCCLHW